MIEVTREIYEQVLDDEGNLIFDENGIALTRFVRTETTLEPESDPGQLQKDIIYTEPIPGR